MSMFQQSGSSGIERHAQLEAWRRIWAPAPSAAETTSVVERLPAVGALTASANLVERSAWTAVQMPFLAPNGSADDDGSINRVSAMKAYEETSG